MNGGRCLLALTKVDIAFLSQASANARRGYNSAALAAQDRSCCASNYIEQGVRLSLGPLSSWSFGLSVALEELR